jgi:hypothetical protein
MPAYPFTLYDEFNSQILLQQKEGVPKVFA